MCQADVGELTFLQRGGGPKKSAQCVMFRLKDLSWKVTTHSLSTALPLVTNERSGRKIIQGCFFLFVFPN